MCWWVLFLGGNIENAVWVMRVKKLLGLQAHVCDQTSNVKVVNALGVVVTKMVVHIAALVPAVESAKSMR